MLVLMAHVFPTADDVIAGRPEASTGDRQAIDPPIAAEMPAEASPDLVELEKESRPPRRRFCEPKSGLATGPSRFWETETGLPGVTRRFPKPRLGLLGLTARLPIACQFAGSCSHHAVVQSLSVRVADVRADHRGGVRGARPGVVVLRSHEPDDRAGQHEGDRQGPDALSATLVSAFLDYVQTRGIFVDPARIRSPKDKPRVENQVAYVRESWFDGETFTDLDDARESAAQWSRDVAGLRVHGTTRQVPREVFEATEKSAMLAPPVAPFDVPLWAEAAKVHPDHHIQVARALYSVPTLYLRKKVRARADKTVRAPLG